MLDFFLSLYDKGSCEWNGSNDYSVHTVCAQMTRHFLNLLVHKAMIYLHPEVVVNFLVYMKAIVDVYVLQDGKKHW